MKLLPDGTLTADGFEDALVGYVRRCGQPDIAIYDYEKAVEVLMKRDGMSHEDAVEWMEFNVVGAWFGPETPGWLVREEDDGDETGPQS